MLPSKFLSFQEVPGTKKTKIWKVSSKTSGQMLGVIRWYTAWRKYSFWPNEQTIFNEPSLFDIRNFIKHENELKKKGS